MSGELVKYFSEVDSEIRVERDRFQKSVFLKLIQRRTEPQLLNWVKQIDLKAEQKAIKDILTSFSVDSGDWEEGFDSHFKTLKKILKDVDDGEKVGFTFNEFEALIAMQHLHAVVQDWDALIAKQDKITDSRNRFRLLLSELMPSKDFSINAKNELEVRLKNVSRQLPLAELSSGEKQLLILLGEAVLQRGKQFLYIADEPELSLHVSWQERIIQVVRSLNPRAQILFATHSPDVVGEFGDRAIDAGRLISGTD